MAFPPGARTLRDLLPAARRHGYAVPAFSVRYLACVRPVVQAAQDLGSPLLVEISQRELAAYGLTPADLRAEVERQRPDVPYGLHLDHSHDDQVLQAALDAGFTSVMIDASHLPFAENVRRSAEVVQRARATGASVEAELGRLTSTDRMETDCDEELFTDPSEAEEFVRRTGCDALAVSVGTAHGVYPVKDPRIDFDRLEAIRRRIPDTPLVLHGGSGLPPQTLQRALRHGIAKVNVATDLEIALLEAMGRERMTSRELDGLDAASRGRGLQAVQRVAAEKIRAVLSASRR